MYHENLKVKIVRKIIHVLQDGEGRSRPRKLSSFRFVLGPYSLRSLKFSAGSLNKRQINKSKAYKFNTSVT